ncbi:hypothetical protein HanLR1_Chr04g0150131 [Helianthus annuus]|nr:hypothetical protein HanHA89_Chr04g0158391 [Helianthus annuus]KAJ0758413.1 hypothetical protein HanLR1_Chr04g0150131 [Helianthus annuus]
MILIPMLVQHIKQRINRVPIPPQRNTKQTHIIFNQQQMIRCSHPRKLIFQHRTHFTNSNIP